MMNAMGKRQTPYHHMWYVIIFSRRYLPSQKWKRVSLQMLYISHSSLDFVCMHSVWWVFVSARTPVFDDRAGSVKLWSTCGDCVCVCVMVGAKYDHIHGQPSESVHAEIECLSRSVIDLWTTPLLWERERARANHQTHLPPTTDRWK